MSAFIIKETSLKKSGSKLFLNFLHLIRHNNNDEHVKLLLDFFDNNVVRLYQIFVDADINMRGHKIFNSNDNIDRFKCFYIDSNFTKEKIIEQKNKEIITSKILNKTIETEFVNDFFTEIEKKVKLDEIIEFELDEDLYCLKKAFLKAYDLFYYSGHNLED